MKSLLAAVAVSIAVIGCATPARNVPLPADVQVKAPDASLPADVQGLSGKWNGVWINSLGRLDHILIVEEVDGSTVSAIYAVGEPSNSYINISPAWRRIKGKAGPGTLDFSFPNGATVNYKLQADGTLAGTYKSQGFNTTARMTRSVS